MAELILRGTLIEGVLRLVGDFGHLQLIDSETKPMSRLANLTL